MSKFLFSFLTLFLIFYSTTTPLFAQDTLVLNYDDYIAQVLANHPIAKQIRMAEQRANLLLLQEKGNQFDPKLEGKWSYKHFDGKNYYNIYDSYLKIPTIIGLDVKVGYNGAQGYYLNPADKLPEAGQAYLGVSIPLLQGLWNAKQL